MIILTGVSKHFVPYLSRKDAAARSLRRSLFIYPKHRSTENQEFGKLTLDFFAVRRYAENIWICQRFVMPKKSFEIYEK